MPSVFEAAPINDQIFRFERENELDKQFVDDEEAEGQSTDLCKFFFSGTGCNRGARCQFRHARNDRLIVCKHWLRGLCKKGEYCEYLHEFDMSKMPECYFFSKFGECSNAECMYRHVDPDKKRNECPYYARGFCKHGPKCRLRHVKREACHDYLAGFCKNGSDCAFGHARFEIPRVEEDDDGAGGIDRFGFGRPKGPMMMTKLNFGGSGGGDDDGGDGAKGGGNRGENGEYGQYSRGNGQGGYGRGGSGGNDGGHGGGGRPPIVCHYCRQPGHIRPKCPLRLAQAGGGDQGASMSGGGHWQGGGGGGGFHGDR